MTEIRSAYRKLAANYHPDVNPGSHEAEEKFKELNEAHEVLSSPEKRPVYDQYGHEGPPTGFGGMGEGGFGDIFDMFFGAGGMGGRAAGGERARQQATQGNDLRYDLEITLEEAAFGVQKTLRLSRLELCDVCHGSGAKSRHLAADLPRLRRSRSGAPCPEHHPRLVRDRRPLRALPGRGPDHHRSLPHLPGSGPHAPDDRASH